MTPMDDVLGALVESRSSLIVALDIIEKRRDQPGTADELRVMVGDLAVLVNRLERERDRWR